MAAKYRCFAIATFFAVPTLLQRFCNAFFLSSRRGDANTYSSRLRALIYGICLLVFFVLFLKAPILFSSFESCLVKISVYCKGLTAGGEGGGVVVVFFHFGF